jgi:hypothetical protein
MARTPEWFERLDGIIHVLRDADTVETLGRNEVRAIFGCSERDSIRLLHRFGASQRNDALVVDRPTLLRQLEEVRAGDAYAAFLRRCRAVAGTLSTARHEAAARTFRVRVPPEAPSVSLATLPETIAWRRKPRSGRGRLEIAYRDGADLMNQIAAFLSAVSSERDEFFSGTEPADAAE